MYIFLHRKSTKFVISITFRKPRNATNIGDQVEMLIRNIFKIIYNSVFHIKKMLLNGGFVLNLIFPGHEWKFPNGGKQYYFFL